MADNTKYDAAQDSNKPITAGVLASALTRLKAKLHAVATSGSYNDLTDKPAIPTKVSELAIDGNVVVDAAYVHTDNNYSAEEKAKVAASQANVIETVKVNNQALSPDGAKAVNVTVPTSVSDLSDADNYALAANVPTNNNQLTNGAGYQTASDVQTAIAGKADSADLGSAAAKNSEDSLTNGSNLPTGSAVKTFVEDKGYQTASDVTSAIAGYGYQTASDVQSAVNTALSATMAYKGTKATVGELPSSGNKTGDVWHVTADGSERAWNGSAWEELGSNIDMSDYLQASDALTVAEAQDMVDAIFAA